MVRLTGPATVGTLTLAPSTASLTRRCLLTANRICWGSPRSTSSTRRRTTSRPRNGSSPDPKLRASAPEIQPYGTLRRLPIGLPDKAKAKSCELVNEILADSMVLYSLYKKHHWLVAGPTFYQLHLLFDKHAEEQNEVIDQLAERVQALGGIAVGDPRHVAEMTRVPRPPNGAEEVPAMLSRLLEAHEIILTDAHDAATRLAEAGDDGSNDLLVSNVIRTNELQTWFIAEHLVDTPAV